MSHHEDDEEVVDQTLEAEKQAPVKPGFASGSLSTPSNTLFAKDGSTTAQKRAFEGQADSANLNLVSQMLDALLVTPGSSTSAIVKDDDDDDNDDDDDDDEDDEDENDEDGEEEDLFIADPEEVEAALPGLRANQEEIDQLKDEYTKARRDLEVKYEQLRAPLLTARAALVRGDILPGFWLDAMRKNTLLNQFVEEWDEPSLMFLDNITCTEITHPDEYGFELEFHFAEENPFFSNKSLKKRAVITNHYPMDGSIYPDVETLVGTEIDWKPNQNLTVRVEVKKEIKRAGKGTKRGPPKEVRQEVPQESFFTFFETPADLTEEQMAELNDEEQEQVQRKWETDFAIATTFRSKLVPNALMWYTGEASESEYDDDDEEDDEDYDDDDDDDEGARFQPLDDDADEDSDEFEAALKQGKKKGGAKARAAAKNIGGDEEKKPECQQQ
ncbi:hypothetical protein BASA81_013757 [Batrachochytrium salamandrivorans]|nr:hypothetical protein BASA81_013757 [Batrachochytrium salamandrivorans]